MGVYGGHLRQENDSPSVLVRPWTIVDELVGQLAQDNEAQTNHPHSLSPQPYIATYDTIVFSIPVVRCVP